MQKTKRGSRVELEVEVLDDDGELVERTHPEEDFEIKLGTGELPDEVEAALIGVEAGTTIEVRTPPGVAFADHNPEAIVSVPREDFDEGVEIERGAMVGVAVEHDDGSSDEIDAVIIEVNEDAVILDANHPLAGKAATFRVKVVQIVG